MSDTPAQLPKLKEKVMYVTNTDSKTKIESSYVISSSYKGIVRLSPNNHTTVNERIIAQLSPQDEASLGTTYTDAIVFQDQALKSIKTDADITRRMIIGSDSDGYLVNFRLGINDVQFDTLGVIGITETNQLQILTSKSSYKDDILTLNKTPMPAFAQTRENSSPFDNTLDIPNGDRSLLDVNHIEVQGTGDKSHLLYAEAINKKRVFKYKQTQRFIKELIMQALLELQTIPVGSVHWLPVSIEQYKALLDKGHMPNKTYYNQVNETDPIVRDYLLCDGRQYNNSDFPELAKILWGEKITIWKKAGGIDGISDHHIHGYYPEQHINEYKKGSETEQAKHTFRVPDLRHMFISSCHFASATSFTKDPEIDTYKKEWNTTGLYTIDNTPSNLSPNISQDNHVHFIAYGTNGMVNRSNSQNFTLTDKIASVATPIMWGKGDKEYNDPSEFSDTILENQSDVYAYKLKISDQENSPRIMYLQNHPIYRNTQFGSGTSSKNGSNGFSYGQFAPQRSCEWKNLRTNWSQPAIMYLSMPGGTEKSTRSSLLNILTNDNMVGKSSVQIPSVAEVHDNTVYGSKNNELNNEAYVEFKKNIYGHESSPKFYAMLPLIKI